MNQTLQALVIRSERWATGLAATLHNISIMIVLPGLILLVAVDVVMRYVFNSSIQGGTEIAGLMLLLVFVSSMPYCTLRHGNVYMEAIYSRTSGTARWLLDMLATLCGLAFMSLFAVEASRLFRDMIRYNEGGVLIDIPYWPFAGAMFLCGAFVSVVFVLHLIRLAAGLPINREEHADE
jgi:TRAP-type C4-dicarboxylate transport system permease small subunit